MESDGDADAQLDRAFLALADPVRRAIVARLSRGPATVNELAVPVDRPVTFKITATDVMNTFYVPTLAGMIYAMPGMETKLHAVVNRAVESEGRSAHYSGAGFSNMFFKFRGVADKDFDAWVAKKGGGAPAATPTTNAAVANAAGAANTEPAAPAQSGAAPAAPAPATPQPTPTAPAAK